jgi:hypothetical protein
MNDALLLTDRLCDLTELALQATTKLEKATVFAATRGLKAEFEEVAANLPDAALEKLSGICSTILAAVEYAPPAGKNNPQCIVTARKDISALREMLRAQPGGFMPREAKRAEARLGEILQ